MALGRITVAGYTSGRVTRRAYMNSVQGMLLVLACNAYGG